MNRVVGIQAASPPVQVRISRCFPGNSTYFRLLFLPHARQRHEKLIVGFGTDIAYIVEI
jgi:hypothetical protein